MKSTLLKTLAAASLVATSHAQVHVLGASWKERGVSAPNGTIQPNPGTVAAPRAYLILDDSATNDTTPNAATYIEYGERRGGGTIDRYYTINTDFRAFLADGVNGDSGGRRLYGHMHVPLTISTVANPMIPFTGTTFSSNFPKKISFDQTVFQTGASDTVTGPQILVTNPSTLRSVMSGSANPVKVSATDKAGAADELLARLVKKGYTRDLVEAPVIVEDLNPTETVADGKQVTLKVELSPDSIPGPIPGTDPVEFDDFAAPTYEWFKNDVLIPGAVGNSYTVTGGPSTATNGIGSYKVVVRNDIGSVTSTTSVVTAINPTFVTNLPPTATLTGAQATILSVVLDPANPVPTPTYQWMKSPTGATNSFVAVSPAFGGNNRTLTVIGGEVPPAQPAGQVATGAGHYRLDVTTTAGLTSSSVCIVTVNAANNNFVFTTNLPRTRAIALDANAVLTVAINAGGPAGVYQWSKAPLNNPTAFTDIVGANTATLTVSGNAANEKGPGVYRVTATTAAGVTPVQTTTTLDCTVTTAP
jgi:hypothetical protein